jgi:hypothetical protein
LAVPCTFEDIAAAIDQILVQNAEKPVFAIIQQYIQPAWRGHMSNERRISPKRSSLNAGQISFNAGTHKQSSRLVGSVIK